MGSPISPIVANLFMEDLEVQAIRTSPTPPSLWKRFVDDTFTIIKKEDRSSFLQHLNSIHQNIKFTCEELRDDGSMPFLDILVTPKEDGSSVHQCLENQPTLIQIYSGTVNTPYLPNTVWLVPCITEPKQYDQTHSCKRKKKNICAKPSRNASTQSGPSIEQELKAKNLARRTNNNSNNQNGPTKQ